jgi:F-type H+-transporting ATPase subunit epsilon
MLLEIITPDKKLFEGEVSSVSVPGTSGRFQMLNRHAPIISALKKGKIKIKTSQGVQQFDVSGGVVEMNRNKIIILAE